MLGMSEYCCSTFIAEWPILMVCSTMIERQTTKEKVNVWKIDADKPFSPFTYKWSSMITHCIDKEKISKFYLSINLYTHNTPLEYMAVYLVVN